MLSGAYEANSRLLSVPMSAPQPLGVTAGSGLGISAPSGVVIGPGQLSGASSVVSAPLSGQLSSGLIKNGAGMQGAEEEVL